nr:hypothetical protein [Streptomyces sp. AJS327]
MGTARDGADGAGDTDSTETGGVRRREGARGSASAEGGAELGAAGTVPAPAGRTSGGGPAAEDDEPGAGSHGSGCLCGDCPHGARAAHQRAAAVFARRRDEFARGEGVPAALTRSAGASRQWISDELTRSARNVADRGRAEGAIWLTRLWRHTLIGVWAAFFALLFGQLLTAVGGGWSVARTAGLLAAALAAALLSLAARFHRARGGALAPLIGEDNRLSTSRAVAAGWVFLTVYVILVLSGILAGSSDPGRRDALIAGLDLARGAALLTVLALTCAVAVVVRRTVTVRVAGQRLQKVPADRPRATDLLTDDAGRGTFTDVQYVLVNAVALVFTAVRLARQPERLPDLPWGLALLTVVSAAVYLAGKYAEGGRPVVLSVVRARELGDLHAPIRTGDDIEIRGAGFVPPGAGTPERLARMVVRVGAVHVHVPLIPVEGGFVSPSDTVLTVPVPVEVEPGRVDVQVVTAAGVETNRCPIDVQE